VRVAKLYAWALVGAAAAGVWLLPSGETPPLSTFLFWIALLIAVELLPVSLDFESQVTMGFPILLAAAMLFPPWAAMAIAGIGSIDPREVRREIKLHHALFNRAQTMIAVGAGALVFSPVRDSIEPVQFSALFLAAAVGTALVYTAVNLGLVSFWVALRQEMGPVAAFRSLLPDPPAGFWFSYLLLAGLGLATAVVYANVDYGAWAVAAFIIPLLFARLSIIGARARQRLTEQMQQQQQRLLATTESVLQEREEQRNEIAAHIHDSSLQLLAAATYGAENALAYVEDGDRDNAVDTLKMTRSAIDQAIKSLRGSLVDLRRTSVEEGGLMATAEKFIEHASTLWGVRIDIEGNVSSEPPVSVALGAFQILQESLANALKHSNSDTISVKIEDVGGALRIVVEDEGKGFAPDHDAGSEHLGMRLMKDRAAQLGGRIELDTAPGRGTRVEAVLPGGVMT
jgi:signal transduction histidine kinase